MDFDEFDDVVEVPLAQRLAKKGCATGAPAPFAKIEGSAAPTQTNAFYISDDDEDPINSRATNLVSTPFSSTVPRRIHENSVLLTPPPPLSPYKSTKPEAFADIKNLLKKKEKPPAKRKAEKTEPVKAAKERKEVTKVSKEVKEAEKMANKQTDKSEVNKYVLVLMDPALISAPPGPEILNVLTNPPTGKQEEVFQYRVENQRVPGTLTWKRKIIHFTVAAGQPVISSSWVYERRSLVFVSAADVAEKIHSGTLEAWAESVKEELGRSNHVTLMVYDFNNYFRQDKNMQERARKAAIRGEQFKQSGSTLVTEYQMQESLLTLSINRVMDHLTFDKASDKGWKDCASSVFHQTRAVAEAPEKIKKSISSSASFEFYAKADGKDCISPKNLTEYWKQVLMQVSVISLEKATAIARLYPSPSHLSQAYRGCSSVKAAEKLLADIEIRRVDTIVGGTRRIGDEISRKVYLAFTLRDQNSFLAQ